MGVNLTAGTRPRRIALIGRIALPAPIGLIGRLGLPRRTALTGHIALPARLAPLLCLALLLQAALPGPACGAAPSELLPSIEDTVRIDEWQYLGPFSAGYREGIQSAVPYPALLTPTAFRSGQTVPGEFRSILTQGGAVTWKAVSPDSTGWVNIEFDSVYWDTIMDIYGYAGLVNMTFAYAEMDAPRECRALIVAERVGTFYLNQQQQLGGPYGHDFVRVPVVLKKGENRILLSLSGFAGHRFRFEMVPVPAPVILLDDYTTPDLAEHETGRFWAGITLLNTTTSRIRDAVISLGDGGVVATRGVAVGGLAPLCVKKVPVELEVISPPGERSQISIPVSVASAGAAFSDSMCLRVRAPGESFKRTFISRVDGSCQYFAVLPPEDFQSGQEYALILTLHGAGVRAEGQVEAYKPKTWAYVVAPTNRRPYGFDWQDWGRLDALEVLEIAKEAYPIDSTRVYLTGHSMGGHGVWHVGLNHPDLFAAIAPEAGWTSFGLYIPWFLQKGYIHGDPRQVGMRDVALMEDRTLNFVENAMNLPVFILHGGGDDNVPTVHSRMFVERLENLGAECGSGYEYRYWEVPGRGHWWHDDSLDVSCVDYPEVMDFLASRSLDADPRRVSLKTVNLATTNRAYWLEITRQEEPMKETFISAVATGQDGTGNRRIFVGPARNVREFKLRCPDFFRSPGLIRVLIGQEKHDISVKPGETVILSRRAGKFRPGPVDRSKPAKTRDLYGPIKQAYFSPFVMVYGTQLDEGRRFSWAEKTLHQARLQAFRWWRRGNGYVDVIPDTCVTDSIVAGCSLILFGDSHCNSVLARIERDLPIGADMFEIYMGGQRVRGATGAVFIYPNPLNPDRFVVAHVGRAGLESSFNTLYAGAGLPDYIIYGEEVQTMGWAGVICTGFFDNNWKVDPALMFMAR